MKVRITLTAVIEVDDLIEANDIELNSQNAFENVKEVLLEDDGYQAFEELTTAVEGPHINTQVAFTVEEVAP